jgi:hypothetical protein
MITAEITSTTNLQTVTPDEDPSQYSAVQIVEIDDASVQLISGTYGTGATKDITVTTISESKTFWFFTATTPGVLTFDSLPYLSYVDSTTLRFTRAIAAAGLDLTLKTYVVSVPNRVSVQNVLTVIASGTGSISKTFGISPIEKIALLINGLYQRFGSINAADDDAGGNMMVLINVAASSFDAYRTNSPALNATANVQVIVFDETFIDFAVGRGIMRGVGAGIM